MYNPNDYKVLSKTQIVALFLKHGIPCPTQRLINLFFNYSPEITQEIGNQTHYYRAKFTTEEGDEIIERINGPAFSQRSKNAPTKGKKDEIFQEFRTLFLEIEKEILEKRPKLTYQKTA